MTNPMILCDLIFYGNGKSRAELALGVGHGEKDGYTREQVEKIIATRDGVRSSQRQDIRFIHAGTPHLHQ